VVGSDTPPTTATAPATKPLPFRVTVKEPTGRFAGWTDASVGYGFRSVMVVLAETVGLALLVAVTVTVFGLGMAAGGVYRPPFAVMVPAPVAGAIVQVTPVVVVPVTLAENC
jgi:hypothetical protein